MRARLIAVLFVALLAHAGVAAAAPAKYRSATISLDATHSIVVSSSKASVYARGKSNGRYVFGVSERRYLFGLGGRKNPPATVLLTVRRFPSGDVMVFAKLDSKRRSLPATVTYKSPATQYAAHRFNLHPNSGHDKHLGVDRSSGPYGWVGLSTRGATDRNVFMSKAYAYKLLKRRYSGGGTSTLKSLASESDRVKIGRNSNGATQIALGLSASKNSSCDRYFLITPRSIDETDTSKAYLAEITAGYGRWIDPSGPNRKTGWSVEPYTRQGFGHSLLLMRVTDLLRAYKNTGNPVFETLLYNNEYTLALTRARSGLWYTDYTSTWVKNGSGVHAPYIDTRHNEALALTSVDVANVFAAKGITRLEEIRGWDSAFSTFLRQRAAANAVIHTANGYFFADYYDSSGRVKTHVSLNHALGEMNYLLVRCGETSSSPQFDVAMGIKAAVDDCGAAWIRKSNSDLYYQRNLSGSYSGTDYVTVTYWDLLLSQQLFTKLLGAPDPIFAELIASKEKFLGITNTPTLPGLAPAAATEEVEPAARPE